MLLQDFLESLNLGDWGNEFVQEAIIAVILGLVAVMGRVGIRWYRDGQARQLKQDLHPYFSSSDIKKATQFYVPTQFQSVPPSQHGELIQANTVAARQKLIPFFLKKAFHPSNDHQRFYIVLAGSGMGKTTFMINLYVRYLRYSRRSRRAFHIRLVPLGYPEILQRIDEIPNQSETILLLDGLDEDPQAVRNYRKRMEQILKRVKDFRVVVFTCRTQFFPSEEEEPRETKVARFGSFQGFQEFAKMYLAPFSPKDIKLYLRNKYGWFQGQKKQRAMEIVQQSPNLIVRPMLLNYMDDLLEEARQYEYTAQLYEVLIRKWIEREADRVLSDRRKQFREELYRFSQEIAINIYKNRAHRRGWYIGQNEIKAFSDRHKIQLDEIEMRSRSLLNRNMDGQYKFAHKSILEYFLAREMVDNASFAKSFVFEGMDQAKQFYQELLILRQTQPWLKAQKGKGELVLEENETRDPASLKSGEYWRVTSLRLEELKSVRVISPMSRLRKLQLDRTQIKALESIEDLQHLESVSISHTAIRDLKPLASLPELQSLHLDHCPVSDLSPLKNLRNLRQLSFAHTEVAQVDSLYELFELEKLHAHHTSIRDIAPLRKLKQLRSLHISHTPLANTNPVRAMESLQSLDLSYTRVQEINALKSLPKLSSLRLAYTPVSDLKPLAKLNRLQRLYLQKTEVKSLRPLYELPSLKHVQISGNQLSEQEVKAFGEARPNCTLELK
ncbi:MAG: hypothetical protein AAFQ68_21860 [Bacteroidota bacterium]